MSVMTATNIIESYFINPVRAFFLRLKNTPFQSVDELGEFLQTRSSFVAQTALYGYLKTRMGTRYRNYFEDEKFGQAIQTAAANLYGTCLADLTLYTCARLVRDGAMSPAKAKALAKTLFEKHLNAGLSEVEDKSVEKDAMARFAGRLKIVKWDQAIDIYKCFAPSEVDIIRFAPVVEDFKERDKTIVGNSVRLRWNDVRAQLVKRLDEPSIVRMVS